jgi:hypothetical protein
MCNCQKWVETIVAIVVFILALWPQFLGTAVSKWVLVIAALALVVHAWFCNKCVCETEEEKPAMKPKKRK